MLVPVGRRLVVIPQGETTVGNIVVPGKSGREVTQLPRVGKVAAVGIECQTDDKGNKRIGTIPDYGDTIYYNGWVTAEVEDGKAKFVMVEIADVLCIVRK